MFRCKWLSNFFVFPYATCCPRNCLHFENLKFGFNLTSFPINMTPNQITHNINCQVVALVSVLQGKLFSGQTGAFLTFQNKNRPCVYTYDESKKEKNTTQKEALAQKNSRNWNFFVQFLFLRKFRNFFLPSSHFAFSEISARPQIFSPTRYFSRAFSTKGNERKKLPRK